MELAANRLRRPRANFVEVSVVALVVYAVMPLLAAEETSTAIWLNVMHLAAAVPIVGLLACALPTERAAAARSETETLRSTV